MQELAIYNEKLLLKPAMVFLNKTDLYTKLLQERVEENDVNEDTLEKVRQFAKDARQEVIDLASEHGMQVIEGSAHVGNGAGELAHKIRLLSSEGMVR